MPALVASLKNRVIVMGYLPGFQVCAAYGIEKLNQAVLTVSLITNMPVKSLGLFLALSTLFIWSSIFSIVPMLADPFIPPGCRYHNQ